MHHTQSGFSTHYVCTQHAHKYTHTSRTSHTLRHLWRRSPGHVRQHRGRVVPHLHPPNLCRRLHGPEPSHPPQPRQDQSDPPPHPTPKCRCSPHAAPFRGWVSEKSVVCACTSICEKGCSTHNAAKCKRQLSNCYCAWQLCRQAALVRVYFESAKGSL